MKTEFASLIPTLVLGMDGASKIPSTVADFDTGERVPDETAGSAVDFAILCAFSQAERQGEGLEEVLNHVRYITQQLGIIQSNLKRRVNSDGLSDSMRKLHQSLEA